MDNATFNSLVKDAMETPAWKVWRLLRGGMENYFKAFFYGDPVLIPESLMPCIVVDTVTTAEELGPMQYDEVNSDVLIKVIFNKKDDFGGSPDTALTKQKVEFFTEGRDKTTGQYLPMTIKGILRKNISVENETFNMAGRTRYDVIIRPEETMTQESHTTISLNGLIQVPNRS